MRKNPWLSRMLSIGIVGVIALGWNLSGLCMEEVTTVAKILTNPSAFHRHKVVLKGVLKLVSRWEGKDTVGSQTCGPIFQLDDDSGDIPVLYIIRCDAAEVGKVTAMAGQRVTVEATIEATTVVSSANGDENKTRAMASKIYRTEE